HRHLETGPCAALAHHGRTWQQLARYQRSASADRLEGCGAHRAGVLSNSASRSSCRKNPSEVSLASNLLAWWKQNSSVRDVVGEVASSRAWAGQASQRS